ncbi:PorP/SprF family type IX secretion system membrane protein [Flavobacterium sp.]|uniref:PorP/SprF family type IX secretion system membrane protein n=1 Tax=Flavobacterium sp. TaxID=239 RepID=UPI003752B998
MKIKFRIVLFIILSLFTLQSKAQDPVFTQYSLIPEILNPGFTGFQFDWRAGLIHRRQWPDGNRVIDTEYGFLNRMVGEKAGLGITFLNQREVFTKYNYLQVNFAYSYKVDINYEWSFRPAIEVGYGRKSYNFQNLLLEDQINSFTGAINNSSIDQGVLNQKNNINFIDISAGFIIDNESGWFGASLKHLNRPNISFLNEKNVPLDLFLSIHGGYAFELENTPSMLFPENTKLLVTANYMRQSQFNRLDIGTALKFENLSFGATAVINPERKSTYSHFLTSINPFISVHLGNFNLGYSYDFSTSKLGHTQGIHEISLTWQLRFCETCVAKENKYYDYNK